MQALFRLLKTVPLFAPLSNSELEMLAENAEACDFPAGECVTTPPPDTVTVVLQGSVAVMKNDLLMRMLSVGSLSGVASVYGNGGSPMSCLKANTASRLVFLRGEDIRSLIRSNPDFSEAFIKFLTSRIRFLNTRIRAYTSGSAEAKLAFHILYSDENKSGTVELGVSMSSLADMLDIGRASLYRACDALTASGAIERCGSTIIIKTRDLLTLSLHKKQ